MRTIHNKYRPEYFYNEDHLIEDLETLVEDSKFYLDQFDKRYINKEIDLEDVLFLSQFHHLQTLKIIEKIIQNLKGE